MKNGSENELMNIEEALMFYQEFYNLPIDGTLNEETAKLMAQPRCGVTDDPTGYATAPTKWRKNILKWHFSFATKEQIEVAEKAFETWSNEANIQLVRNFSRPDIIISMKRSVHHFASFCQGQGRCVSKFDGEGGVLGHAYFPQYVGGCIEIHLDADEHFYMGLGGVTPPGQISMLQLLTHEIGHSLGLKHSRQNDSVMYAYYKDGHGRLSEDDIQGIQSLYGKPITTPTKTTTTTTVATTTTTTTQKPTPRKITETATTAAVTTDSNVKNGKLDNVNLCKIHPDALLITSNHHLLIFYQQYVWILEIGEEKYRKPLLIDEYLPNQLTSNMRGIKHIYQSANGHIMVIIDEFIYIFDFPSFVIRQKNKLSDFGIGRSDVINAFFTSYSGRSYILYQNYYYVEIDECTMRVRSRGTITDLLPGVPIDLNGGFRYINGNMYFFRNNTYYEFNEFKNKVTAAGDFNLQLFNIQCPQKNILQQLKQLLLNLSQFVE
ncbi:hypothetical protein NQ315_013873 [Exocentrus adspersus]|uniref:Peptidase metallopeptidase domain-containing protein n=1 Tax=Exocentrus adspersus TaxID=1586481 RepID=A0AAV8VGZ9_9CUCU|nr:hypothetical protein NQ315_013873 [Exocentrus adspersus]